MNRREALAALVALPEVSRISVAHVQPDEVIVVESDDHLSSEACAHVRATISEIWPDRKIAVFSKGLRMRVTSA